jgi:probable phosphoglycerate mutase
MTRILLIRHGHVEGIAPERFRGRADLPLTSLGVAQARAVAERIASGWRPAKVYTSPLDRCVATGAAIAKACGAPTEVMRALIDIDYGAWQGRSCAEIEQGEPKLYAAWRTTPHLVRFPGGDSLQDLAARTADALRLALARHPGETVVLLAHDSVNRALLLQLLEQPLSAYWRLAQAPCCINEVEVADGRVQVLRANETAHLDAIAPTDDVTP